MLELVDEDAGLLFVNLAGAQGHGSGRGGLADGAGKGEWFVGVVHGLGLRFFEGGAGHGGATTREETRHGGWGQKRGMERGGTVMTLYVKGT